MRIGKNPYQNKKTLQKKLHRIIVPVFIPDLEQPYYNKGLEVTKMCIESLIKTKSINAGLTIVNNGSCKAVTTYLQELYWKGSIDQLVHHRENLGKIDAVLPIARTSEEALITITDSDVLFLNGWIQAVESVFVNFPRAGMVSPVPHGTTYSNYTVNTLFDGWTGGMLSFQGVCKAEDMLRFAESIGRKEQMYRNKSRLEYQLTLKNSSGFSAVVGCGHFVATYRREVFEKSPRAWSHWAYASEADRDYLDIPNENAGFWRLATVANLAYHMGNNPTAWMRDLFLQITQETQESLTIPAKGVNRIPFFVKSLVVRLLLSTYLRKFWFKSLGLKQYADVF